jgi:hypothetical protein
LRKEGTVQRKKLEGTVKSWKNKPGFETLIGLDKGTATALTGPVGNKDAVQHWEWTDEGTKPHTIRARRKPYLRFRYPSKAKTKPGSFTSGRGSKGRNWAMVRSVSHPGTKARNWSKKLQKQRRRPYTRSMIKAIQRGAKKLF